MKCDLCDVKINESDNAYTNGFSFVCQYCYEGMVSIREIE